MNIYKENRSMGTLERISLYVAMPLAIFALVISIVAINSKAEPVDRPSLTPKLRVERLDGDGRKQLIQDPQSGCAWVSSVENVYKLRGGPECEVKRL
ncbi:hypothetical protein HOU02_gp271 [Caulobacter phage CcrBL9]|uniref:Uncharacterized protein n=1 Tax=Caulobacter phage CcrBL9 TaxID=2283270 RepID=A0A385EC39_9CAUD|nr:hypothetical protein HOU02_gp271 [Caulobacter phage CcrBL9]AXQ69454.1 hypothetical protein CcrBL9_gp430 [Caulobacter phage CcrBL9]